MGKGDIKTYRGKLFNGSYGNKRPRKAKRPRKGQVIPTEQIVTKEDKKLKKSKFDLKREKIFEIFKDHLNFLNDKGFVSTEKDVYICPLDLKVHHHVYEKDPDRKSVV